MNILELIDSILPQNDIPIYFVDFPDSAFGLLIDESGVVGEINSFNGFDGVISSVIQFFVRVEPKNGKYREIERLLRRFYKIVQENKGIETNGVKLLYVGEFNLTPAIRDEKNNFVWSLSFPIIYKERDFDGIE